MDHCIVTSVNDAKFERRQRKRIDGIITFGGTFGWNVWKEQSKRTFQHKSLQPRVALLRKDDIQQFQSVIRPIIGGE